MRLYLLIVFCLLVLTSGCGKKTSYSSSDNMELSGAFSVQDQEKLIKDIFTKLSKDKILAKSINIDKNTLLIGQIVNKTSEYINTVSITDTLKVNIWNVNLFKIINRNNIDLLNKEQALYQSGLTSAASATKVGKLWGVKYVLYGNFNSIVNYVNGSKNISYSLNISIQDIETGQEIWIGQSNLNKVTK